MNLVTLQVNFVVGLKLRTKPVWTEAKRRRHIRNQTHEHSSNNNNNTTGVLKCHAHPWARVKLEFRRKHLAHRLIARLEEVVRASRLLCCFYENDPIFQLFKTMEIYVGQLLKLKARLICLLTSFCNDADQTFRLR